MVVVVRVERATRTVGIVESRGDDDFLTVQSLGDQLTAKTRLDPRTFHLDDGPGIDGQAGVGPSANDAKGTWIKLPTGGEAVIQIAGTGRVDFGYQLVRADTAHPAAIDAPRDKLAAGRWQVVDSNPAAARCAGDREIRRGIGRGTFAPQSIDEQHAVVVTAHGQ